MSCSNHHKSKVLHLLYMAVNSTFGKDVKIKRDSLHHRYDVNKYGVELHAQNTKYAEILDFLKTLCLEKLNLGDSLDSWTEYSFYSPIHKYHISFELQKDSLGKSSINVFLF